MAEGIGGSLSAAAVTGMTVALIGAAFAWAARCGQQFHRVEASTRDKVNDRLAAQEERIGGALALILQAVLPEIFAEYLTTYRPRAPLTVDELRHAAAEMKRDEDAADLVARQLVTQPVINGLLPGLTQALPVIASTISRLPAVDEAILRLRCYAGSMRSISRRATRLAWLFGIQAILLIIVVVTTLAMAVGAGIPIAATGAFWVGVIAHGLYLELQLRRLENDVAVVPSIVEEPRR